MTEIQLEMLRGDQSVPTGPLISSRTKRNRRCLAVETTPRSSVRILADASLLQNHTEQRLLLLRRRRRRRP